MVRVGLTTKVTLEQRPEGVEGFRHADSWETSVPDRGKTCAKSLRLRFAWHICGIAAVSVWLERPEQRLEKPPRGQHLMSEIIILWTEDQGL